MVSPVFDLDWLATEHCSGGFVLVTMDLRGFVYAGEVNAADASGPATADAARAVVTELLRLARLGAKIEAQARHRASLS